MNTTSTTRKDITVFLTCVAAIVILPACSRPVVSTPSKNEKVHVTVRIKGNSATIAWKPSLNNLLLEVDYYPPEGSNETATLASNEMPTTNPGVLKELKKGKYKLYVTQGVRNTKATSTPGVFEIVESQGINDPISNIITFTIE